ncbi:MAG: hypothetical protein ACKO3G_02310, partial [Planctomycetaceae bacterium]
RAVSRSLETVVGQYLDSLDVTFSETMGRLRSQDVSLVGPGGALAVGTPVHLSGATWRVPFTPLPDVGWYEFRILVGALDVAGNELDQDDDGVPGGPSDAYVTSLQVAEPDRAPEVTIVRDGLRISGSFRDPGAGQTFTATYDAGDGLGPRELALAADGTFAFDLPGAAFADVVVAVTDNHAQTGTATVARAVSVVLAAGDVTFTGSELGDALVLSTDADGFLRHDLPLGGGLTSAIDMDSSTPGEQKILAAAAGTILVEAGAGGDSVDASALGRGVELRGGADGDVLVGSTAADTIDAGDGDDQIDAGPGDDVIHAGVGSDIVAGGTGEDRVEVVGTPAVDAFVVTAAGFALNGRTTALAGVDSLRYGTGGAADDVSLAPGLPFVVIVSGIAPTVEMRREGDAIIGRVTGSFTDPGDRQTWSASIDPGDGQGARVLSLAADNTFTYQLPDRPVMDISVRVTDDEGNTGTASVEVTGVNRFLPTGAGDWGDPANWSLGHVPLAGGDELTWIPSGATARITGDTTVGPLRARGALEFLSGTATFVSDTIVAGIFRASPGTSLEASGDGASLVTTGTAVIDGVTLRAAAGARISLGGAGAAEAGPTAREWIADGEGSVLELPGLVTLRGTIGPDAGVLSIRASAGGRLTLGKLETVVEGSLDVGATGSGSLVEAPTLVAWNSSGAVGTLGATGGGSVSFGAASPTLAGVTVTAGAAGALAAGELRLGAGALLTGTGFAPSIVNVGGLVRPAGTAVGTLTISGSFTQAAAGVLELDIDGLDFHDRVAVTGNASVGGTVRVVNLG